jgi:2-amino-4-hydroxy-6-hydroxymethyldihydropteridine diphosphokinase
MKQVYLLLGSNEGNRGENIAAAKRLIDARCGQVLMRSLFYETEAWGMKEQSPFLNQALMIVTALEPLSLLSTLKEIEKEVGRIETTKWGPRIIDIDILFYGEEIHRHAELIIPHPYLHERRFTLVPLNEIAPDFIHPVFKKTVNELLKDCPDQGEVKKLLSE